MGSLFGTNGFLTHFALKVDTSKRENNRCVYFPSNLDLWVKFSRKISKQGIDVGDGWKIRIVMTPRYNLTAPPQEFVLIITIKDLGGNDIYTEVLNGLRDRGYVVNSLETRQQIRQRQ